jgi:hypothetical protein
MVIERSDIQLLAKFPREIRRFLQVSEQAAAAAGLMKSTLAARDEKVGRQIGPNPEPLWLAPFSNSDLRNAFRSGCDRSKERLSPTDR